MSENGTTPDEVTKRLENLEKRSTSRVRWMWVLAVVGVGVALLGLVRPA